MSETDFDSEEATADDVARMSGSVSVGGIRSVYTRVFGRRWRKISVHMFRECPDCKALVADDSARTGHEWVCQQVKDLLVMEAQGAQDE